MKLRLLHPRNQNISIIKYHPNWYKQNYLTETLHLFQPNNTSNYLNQINYIASEIYNKNYKKKTLLYKNDNILYDYYEFLIPFSNVPLLNVLNKLKIYVAYENDILDEDTILICADYDLLQKNIVDTEWPLYKSKGTTILIMSIIIVLPHEYSLLDICNKLLHEFRHSIEYIKNSKLALSTDKDNEAYEILENLYLKYKKEYNTVLSALYRYAMNSIYYTQNTEINAHIESTIIEFKKSGLSANSIIELCKTLNIVYKLSDTSNIELASLTINDISVFYQYCEIKNASNFYIRLLNNSSFLKYQEHLNNIYNIIIEANPQKRKYKNIYGIFSYFLKLSEHYFKLLNNAILNIL